jgi:phospholipid/cholesterol/gamma-HCH transport system substrate-binding protein
MSDALARFGARYRVQLVVGLLVVLALISYRIVAGLTEYRLVVPLDSADGLYPGSDVLIAGARAGTVRDIRLQGPEAMVTIALDDAHAPVSRDARVTIRPKSILGEKYVALDPGHGDALASGSTLPQPQVARAVDLQDVVNSLDQPTREKLRTLVIELGGGLAGQGPGLNQTLNSGRHDLDDLAAIANTLAARDQDLQTVIQGLDQVTAELSRSDRSQQLGGLIQSSNALLSSLAEQDAQIKAALTETNAALSRNDAALANAAPALNDIFRQSSQLVSLSNELMGDLANGMANNVRSPHLQEFDQSMRATTVVFGSRDAAGYATRVSIVAGPVAGGTSSGGASSAPPLGSTTAAPGAFDAVLAILLGGGQR